MTEYTTKDVVDRLDQLIAIMKLANQTKLNEIKNELAKDKVSEEIIKLCSDHSWGYSELIDQIIKNTSTSKSTAERRVTELQEMKLLTKTRQGRNVEYTYSGLLE